MASVTSKTIDWTDDSLHWRIEQVRPDDPVAQRLTLGVLLTGRMDQPADAAIDAFTNFCRDQGITLDRLWTVHRSNTGEIVAAAFLAINPGRTGMLFISPAVRPWHPQATVYLVRQIVADQDPQQVAMIQTLLEPGQSEEASVLEASGFKPLATLAYLQRRANLPASHADGPQLAETGCKIVHWSSRDRGLFEEAILASYQDTLDCPGLLGLRPIEDIVEGHRATGQFDAQLWSVCLRENKPVAVMLLSELPNPRAMELVYLGVTKAGRRQGLGRCLTRHALMTAAARKMPNIVLAVDEANLPARRLYESFGFYTTTRKRAMIVSLEKTK